MYIYRHSWSLVGLHYKSITIPMTISEVPCCGERNFICVGSVRSPDYKFCFQHLVCVSCGFNFFIDINTRPHDVYNIEDLEDIQWGYDDIFDILYIRLS